MRHIFLLSALLGAFALVISVAVPLITNTNTPQSPDEPSPLETAAPDFPRTMLPGRSDGSATIRLLRDGEVAEISMYEYLTGAVAAEMPAAFEHEALCAQTVAARTYVYYHMLASPVAAHPEADVCSDYTCCAAFKDDSALRGQWGNDYSANLARIRAAVRQTDGVYITYDDVPILAAFHSSSYGATENAERVWSAALPYLVSVPTPETPENVAELLSSVTVSHSDFRATVTAAYPDAVLGNDAREWIESLERGESGRVSEIVIGGARLTGTQLRALFGLRSAAVTITVGDDIVFETAGYGHGVGLSQHGANLMARDGSGWREIIKAYYTGVALSDEPRGEGINL